MAKQDQQAGPDSRQLQAGRDVNIQVVGVTAADVVAIARAEISRALEDLTATAADIAGTRMRSLEDNVIRRFQDEPELFGAFAEPDFQFSLRDAGRAAASNVEAHTEDLLVDLLANRAETGSGASVRLATSEAIKAADKLSLAALNGLTAQWAVTRLTPADPAVVEQLASMSGVAKALLELGLPTDRGWMRDLDALNLVRTPDPSLLQRKPYFQMLRDRAEMHLYRGFRPGDREEDLRAIEALIPEFRQGLVPHQLKPDHVLLPGSSREAFLATLPAAATIPPELEALMGEVGWGSQDAEAIQIFDSRIGDIRELTELAAWWDPLPLIQPTLTGDVIAFVNSKRHLRFEGPSSVAELLAMASAKPT